MLSLRSTRKAGTLSAGTTNVRLRRGGLFDFGKGFAQRLGACRGHCGFEGGVFASPDRHRPIQERDSF
jgi:hypothetical protein